MFMIHGKDHEQELEKLIPTLMNDFMGLKIFFLTFIYF